MKILLLNQDWFAEEFRAAGHEVVSCGLRPHLDVELTVPLLHIKNILKSFPSKFEPDCVLIHDDSAPFIVTGLEELEVPLVFYSVDAHHHTPRHRLMCRAMDYVFIAQKDYADLFREVGVDPEWLPLWASREYLPSDDKSHSVVFVGSMNPKLNPDRVAFFDELSKHVPIEAKQGDFWKIFPHAHIVMNQTVKGDLNFRVFEAMMSGSLLLTEYSENGLCDLFTPGVHLETYKKSNIQDATSRINELLSNPTRCREIGMRGREEILNHHLAKHRAARVLEVLENLECRPKKFKFYPHVVNAEWLTRRLLTIGSEYVPISARNGFHLIKKALHFDEPLDSELSMYVAYILLEYRRQTGNQEVDFVISELAEKYPELHIFSICRVWDLLNKGNMSLAQQIALELCGGSTEKVPVAFDNFNSIVLSVLENEEPNLVYDK